MASYRFARGARIDLREIARYIRRDNPAASDAVIAAIQETVEFLAAHPTITPERGDLLPGLRVFPCRRPAQNYVVIYEALDTHTLILAIRHGAQDWTREFQRSDE